MNEVNLNEKKSNIIYFDGNCGLCHQFIKFLVSSLKTQQLEKFYFAPINGETFKQDSRVKFINIDSVFVVIGENVYVEGDAIKVILPMLKRRYFPLKFVILMPKFVLNKFYQFIAGHRQQISCYLSKNSNIKLLP